MCLTNVQAPLLTDLEHLKATKEPNSLYIKHLMYIQCTPNMGHTSPGRCSRAPLPDIHGNWFQGAEKSLSRLGVYIQPQTSSPALAGLVA